MRAKDFLGTESAYRQAQTDSSKKPAKDAGISVCSGKNNANASAQKVSQSIKPPVKSNQKQLTYRLIKSSNPKMSAAEYRAYLAKPNQQSHTPGKMNKTEAAYADYLYGMQLAGYIKSYHFEAITLKLANNTRYTPDFIVFTPDGTIEAHEVKGFWRDDAKVKIKVAASLFPHIRFFVIKKDGREWDISEVLA